MDEVERRQQHLAGQEAVGIESLLPEAHQAVLADGRHRLQHGRIRRPLFAPAQSVPAGGDGTRGDDHDDVPVVACGGDFPSETVHRFLRDRARTDLHDGDHVPSSSHVKVMVPTVTSSP